MLNAKLIVVGGDAKSREVNLKLPTVIGRGKEAELTVPHALVSRRHTELFERDGKLFVRDLGSLNGTFVDNAKIEGEKYLAPNQLLTLGNITFRAVYDVGSEATITGPDTVTFEEMKTVEEDRSEEPLPDSTPSVPAKSPAPLDVKSSEVVDRPEVDGPELESSGVQLRQQVSTEPARQEEAQQEPLVEAVESDESDIPGVVEEFEDSQGSIELESDIFQFGLDGEPIPEVSSTGLEQLPGSAARVSTIDEFSLDGAEPKSKPVDSFKIDLGEDANGDPSEVDSGRLASFLKKLP